MLTILDQSESSTHRLSNALPQAHGLQGFDLLIPHQIPMQISKSHNLFDMQFSSVT